MTDYAFNRLLERRIGEIRSVLATKAGEYASDVDRLHNFKAAAELENDTPPDALRGMLRKHWVSVMDLCKCHAAGVNMRPSLIDEKIGDAINYLILLEALLKETPL